MALAQLGTSTARRSSMTRLPFAKPRKSPKKKPSRLPRSAPPKRSRVKPRQTWIKPKKRSASEFARIYGSKARVKWMKLQPCVVCDWAPSDGHHTENGGTSRKGPAESIVPLCRLHHDEFHRFGVVLSGGRIYARVDLRALASLTEYRWQCHLRGHERGEPRSAGQFVQSHQPSPHTT